MKKFLVASMLFAASVSFAGPQEQLAQVRKEVQTLDTLHAAIIKAKVQGVKVAVELPKDAFHMLAFGTLTNVLGKNMPAYRGIFPNPENIIRVPAEGGRDVFSRVVTRIAKVDPYDGAIQGPVLRAGEQWIGIKAVKLAGISTLVASAGLTVVDAYFTAADTVTLVFDAAKLAYLDARVWYVRGQLDDARRNYEAALK